jgi:CHAD domain-containing protein
VRWRGCYTRIDQTSSPFFFEIAAQIGHRASFACVRGNTPDDRIRRAMLRLIRPVISKAVFDRENARLRKAARRLSLARDSDVARQTLATLPLSKGRERDAVAAAIAGFNDDGEPEAEISNTMNQVELDLEQTRRNLHRIRISAHEWKAVEPGLREVYRQYRKGMERALDKGNDEPFHRWRICVKNLYYGLQMLQRVWPERIDKMVAGPGRLQEEIGADHDRLS